MKTENHFFPSVKWNVYKKQPKTESQALKEGWKFDGNGCDKSSSKSFKGRRYIGGDINKANNLLYDCYGRIAGMQAVVRV